MKWNNWLNEILKIIIYLKYFFIYIINFLYQRSTTLLQNFYISDYIKDYNKITIKIK